jgi:hypothetical protein
VRTTPDDRDILRSLFGKPMAHDDTGAHEAFEHITDDLSGLAQAEQERDECRHSCDIHDAAAHIAIKRCARLEWHKLPLSGRPTPEQYELSIIAEVYDELGGGPSDEARAEMDLPPSKLRQAEQERDAALARALAAEAAAERLAQCLPMCENCQAPDADCHIEGVADTDAEWTANCIKQRLAWAYQGAPPEREEHIDTRRLAALTGPLAETPHGRALVAAHPGLRELSALADALIAQAEGERGGER